MNQPNLGDTVTWNPLGGGEQYTGVVAGFETVPGHRPIPRIRWNGSPSTITFWAWTAPGVTFTTNPRQA